MSNRIYVLFAHPALHQSRANRVLVEAIDGMPGVTLQDLYEAYPDFNIDVEAEQQALREHDIIVFQHPFYWYSAPALLKEWQDLVLEYGFAYGEAGNALQGKQLLSVVTTGGGEGAYAPDGVNRYRLRQLLTPFDQTAAFCGMTYLPPFVVHGTLQKDPADFRHSAHRYRACLEGLRDGTLNLAAIDADGYLDTALAEGPTDAR